MKGNSSRGAVKGCRGLEWRLMKFCVKLTHVDQICADEEDASEVVGFTESTLLQELISILLEACTRTRVKLHSPAQWVLFS